MRLGIDHLYQHHSGLIRGRKVGLLAHPASCNQQLVHTLTLLIDAGADVRVLFGPEHGFTGEAQDMEPVAGGDRGPGGIPLISLYGDDLPSLAPPEGALSELDVLVVDLWDVGSRYYTFVWTACLCLRACHRNGVELLLADRPNPLGGDVVEGAPQEPELLSFVGLMPVANRHGLTYGELLCLAAEADGTTDALSVISMQGWQREMLFPQTGLTWIAPSPNMPTFDTALVYPGLCLIEATEISEGRGTTQPFEQFGAPGIDNIRLARALNRAALPGVHFRPVSFKPGFQKHAHKICNGVFLHVTDPGAFLPYATGIAALCALYSEAREQFRWRESPYEFVTDKPAIDLLSGTAKVRQAIESGAPWTDVVALHQQGQEEFASFKKQFELYQ